MDKPIPCKFAFQKLPRDRLRIDLVSYANGFVAATTTVPCAGARLLIFLDTLRGFPLHIEMGAPVARSKPFPPA